MATVNFNTCYKHMVNAVKTAIYGITAVKQARMFKEVLEDASKYVQTLVL